jgi:outer membrane protein assembly factor BamA
VESVRTSTDDRIEVRFGPHLTEPWDVEGTLRWRRFAVGNSLITDLPQMLAVYPNEPGIEGGQIFAVGIRTVSDTRDSQTTPTSGVLATAYFEHANDFSQGQSHPFWIFGAQVTALWPMDTDGQFVGVLNLATQETIGAYIPFWELAALGGGTTLRSYNGNRFLNRCMILVNLEERIRLFEASLFDVNGEVQVAPFFDLGKVFDSGDDLVGKGLLLNYHCSYGVGLRGVVKPSFVGRLDIAFGGHEGVGVTVGLDYPF